MVLASANIAAILYKPERKAMNHASACKPFRWRGTVAAFTLSVSSMTLLLALVRCVTLADCNSCPSNLSLLAVLLCMDFGRASFHYDVLVDSAALQAAMLKNLP